MINTSLNLRTHHIATVIFAIVVLISSKVSGQIAKPGYDDKLLFRGITGLTLGVTQMEWTLKDYVTIRQQSAPLTLAVPISNRLLFTAANYGAITTSGTTKVQDVADTRVSLSYVLPGDKFWLTTGASIPTGKTKLPDNELELMTIMSLNAFGYKVPIFGQGLNGNIGIAYATPLTRRLVFGIGTAFLFKGEYEPIEVESGSTTITYDQGDEVSANIGMDYITYSKVSRISLDVTASYFFEDMLNGESIFQSGPRIMTFAVYSTKMGQLNHQISTRFRYRFQSTSFDQDSTRYYNAGTHFEVQYSLSSPLNSWLNARAVGELKFYTPDQLPIGIEIKETGSAQIIFLGADFGFYFSDVITPMLNFRYGFGEIKILDNSRDEVSYDVSGLEIGLVLKVSF